MDDTIKLYRVIEDANKPPENGWVIVGSAMLYLVKGYITQERYLAGDCIDDLIWSARQYTKRTLYHDKYNFFDEATSIKKKCLSEYDPDAQDDDE